MNIDDDIDVALSYQHDPLGYTLAAYPWGERGTPLEKDEGPRDWQRSVLKDIGAHLANPAKRHKPMLIARASGHGIGKSALIAMISQWGMSTCPNTRVVVTANTDGQLKTKTMPEIVKWFRMAANAYWWKTPATAIYHGDPDAEKSWRLDATPWSENNTEAFAGLHNKGSRIIMIMDEASAIADKVWEVGEGVLTDEDTEILWLVFGNPTRNTGRFRECFRKFRHLWNHRQIDSRTVEGTNKDVLNAMVETYGEDSDIVKVRIRGMFPSMSAMQFIGTEDVDAARARHLDDSQYKFAPVILTCDPAWMGDDELTINKRQGLRFDVLKTMPKNDNDMAVAAQLARLEDEHKADAVFIDAGYGTGIYSAGKTLGRNWTLVYFAGESADPGCANKRAEMWKGARDWLKAGGAIDPKDDVLYQDLIGPELVFRADGKIQLESKKDMKARGLPSPGRGDGLALSFAYPVSPKGVHKPPSNRRDHNPLASR
ncbi:terminase [Variovorax sp. GT1P44]|uniref:terminase n=1 Tax=Variovorax sp. GT1P44 TaxID=3443742 RepID=UPI003F45951F